MIDWPLVFFGTLWISGAALALATVSYAGWTASVRGARLRAVLQQDPYQRALLSAACLFCLGLGLTAASPLETILWLVLAVISAANFISLWRTARRTR